MMYLTILKKQKLFLNCCWRVKGKRCAQCKREKKSRRQSEIGRLMSINELEIKAAEGSQSITVKDGAEVINRLGSSTANENQKCYFSLMHSSRSNIQMDGSRLYLLSAGGRGKSKYKIMSLESLQTFHTPHHKHLLCLLSISSQGIALMMRHWDSTQCGAIFHSTYQPYEQAK